MLTGTAEGHRVAREDRQLGGKARGASQGAAGRASRELARETLASTVPQGPRVAVPHRGPRRTL